MIVIEDLLALMVRKGGSDLHLRAGGPPRIRIDGVLEPVEHEALDADSVRSLATSFLTADQIARLDRDYELDCSFGLEGQGSFRANVFHEQGSVGCVLRLVPHEIAGFEELRLPAKFCKSLCDLRSGLILVTGATGSGKSTSLAAMIDYVNRARKEHIVTIEDPIEFVHQSRECLVTQREIGSDSKTFHAALRSVLRQDPDIVLVGELRDHETVEAALTLAETGHLTFGTLHTSDAVQTINRVVDVFPPHQQHQVRTQLAFSLEGVVSQQLLPLASGRGRALTAELLRMTPGIRALVRDNKTHQIYSHIQTGARLGMQTMSAALATHVRSGRVDIKDAERAVSDPGELRSLLRGAA